MTDQTTPTAPIDGEHPDDEALSASLDGIEQEGLRTHLAGCARCRQRVDEIRAIRDVVRTLPLVDPPFGFYERTLKLGPRPRSTASQRFARGVVGGILGLVLVLVLIALIERQPAGIRPGLRVLTNDLNGLDSASRVAPSPAPPVLPATLAGLPYVGRKAIDDGDGEHEYVMYQQGDEWLAVRWNEGNLEVPADLAVECLPMASGEACYGEVRQHAFAMVERGDRVYLIIGTVDRTALQQAAAEVPPAEASSSLRERLAEAGRSMLDAFGLG
jgi:hypothetical protein